MRYNLITSQKYFDDKSKTHISKDGFVTPFCNRYLGFDFVIIAENNLFAKREYSIEEIEQDKTICKQCLKVLKSCDIFGNSKPVQLEDGEWWFNGQIIQNQDHPMLCKYVTRECTDIGYVVSHSTFKDAIKYCLENPIHNPNITPKDFGY